MKKPALNSAIGLYSSRPPTASLRPPTSVPTDLHAHQRPHLPAVRDAYVTHAHPLSPYPPPSLQPSLLSLSTRADRHSHAVFDGSMALADEPEHAVVIVAMVMMTWHPACKASCFVSRHVRRSLRAA